MEGVRVEVGIFCSSLLSVEWRELMPIQGETWRKDRGVFLT